MNNQTKIGLKNRLKEFCRSLIEQRLAALRNNINQAQAAANSEEKSSAGDKYETSRAMSHLEKEMHARQLAEVMKELANLHMVDVNRICKTGEPGSLVKCTGISFFIAAGLGKHTIDGDVVFFLSPNAHLAKTLIQMEAGDHFNFNHGQVQILEII